MFAKKQWMLVSVILLILTACSSSGQGSAGGESGGSGSSAFSAVVESAVSVNLTWAAISNASGYLIEAKYGSGEYFEVAQVGGDQTAYTHFVVPNSTQLNYRLSEVEDGVNREIGTASASMPGLVPDPVVLANIIPFAPIVGEMPLDFTSMPTIDPLNPDPNAMATLTAFMAGIDPNNPESLDALLPEVTPVSLTQEIGPEGGTISLTDPNGVVYSLEIRGETLEEVTTFTLDPIESIEGLPFSSLLGAVNIFPPIPFNVPLTLTISLADGSVSDADNIVAFIGSSLNHELSMTPIYRDGGAVAINVFWGDTVGIATASTEEVQTQASKIPSDSAEQISQQIAVMQALSGDPSAEGFAAIIAQIFEGLLQQSETGGKQDGAIGRLAAPLMQSRTGIDLWEKISAAQRATSEGPNNPDLSIARLSDQLSDPAKRGRHVNDLVTQIKQFLDTHTGCRTRDELYAQAILDLLYSPSPGFEQELAENFTSLYGLPGEIINCTFQLHIPQSTMVIKVPTGGGGTATETMKVHVDPMPLFVSGRGTDIHFYSAEGYGQVVYESFEFLMQDCPPAIKARAPSNAEILITDLSPNFDAELRVNGFKLRGIKTDLAITSPNLGSVRVEVENGSCRVIGFNATAESPNKWGIAMAELHGPYGGSDNWVVVGEDDYVATNTISNYSSGSITENATMILTVHKEEGDGGTQ